MARQRQGRGKLSSIELLPEHADATVRWAMDALAAREYPQTLILERFNEMLAALDPPAGPISPSAFNRYSMRFSAQARRLAEAREMAATLAERLDDMPEGDVGLMLGETIKALINDVLLDEMISGESPSMKNLLAAAEAVQRLEAARKSNIEAGEKARQAVMRKAVQAIEEGVAFGRIDADAAQKAREIMGFA